MKPCEWDNYFYSNFSFLSSSEVSVVFNISSWHSDTHVPIKCFSQEQFWISKFHQFYMPYYTHNHMY